MTPEFTEKMLANLSSPFELDLPEIRSSLAIGGQVFKKDSTGNAEWVGKTVARNVMPESLIEMLALFARQGNIRQLHWWVESV